MKKILTSIALVAACSVTALAADKKDPRLELMKDMRTMMDAMEQIQRGGLYSSSEEMKLGVKKLQGTLKSLESEQVKVILPKDQVYAYKFAQKTAGLLHMYSNDLLESVQNGRMDDALDDYSQLLKQCTSCHIRIRSW